jgi:hypothetical protein
MDVFYQQCAWISILTSTQVSARAPLALGLWQFNNTHYRLTPLDKIYPKCFHSTFFAFTSTSGQRGFKFSLDIITYQDFSTPYAVLLTQTT